MPRQSPADWCSRYRGFAREAARIESDLRAGRDPPLAPISYQVINAILIGESDQDPRTRTRQAAAVYARDPRAAIAMVKRRLDALRIGPTRDEFLETWSKALARLEEAKNETEGRSVAGNRDRTA